MYVIDASIVVKWFVEEADTGRAEVLLQAYRDGRIGLAAPDLLIYEVSNALLRNAASPSAHIPSCIQQLYDLELDLIAPSADLVIATIQLAATVHLTFYDALYAALADELGVPLITADQRVLERLPAPIKTTSLANVTVTGIPGTSGYGNRTGAF